MYPVTEIISRTVAVASETKSNSQWKVKFVICAAIVSSVWMSTISKQKQDRFRYEIFFSKKNRDVFFRVRCFYIETKTLSFLSEVSIPNQHRCVSSQMFRYRKKTLFFVSDVYITNKSFFFLHRCLYSKTNHFFRAEMFLYSDQKHFVSFILLNINGLVWPTNHSEMFFI